MDKRRIKRNIKATVIRHALSDIKEQVRFHKDVEGMTESEATLMLLQLEDWAWSLINRIKGGGAA